MSFSNDDNKKKYENKYDANGRKYDEYKGERWTAIDEREVVKRNNKVAKVALDANTRLTIIDIGGGLLVITEKKTLAGTPLPK